MTQKAALCQHLLDGGTVSVMTAFKLFGMTNASREIGRSIEREETGGFGVIVSRLSKPFKSRYGHVGVYFEYASTKQGTTRKA